MKKIILSLAVIVAGATMVTGATMSYFSDTETSTGNTFTAGSIDLMIDSECHHYVMDNSGYYYDQGCYDAAGVSFGNWELKDLEDGVEKFFNFHDLKPGDWGENTISLHVYDNDAWGRIYFENVTDLDNTCTEPEIEDETDCLVDLGTADENGELDENMEAMMWLDQGMTPGFQCLENEPASCIDPGEGDNLHQDGEPVIYTSITDEWSYNLADIISEAAYKYGEGDGLNLDGRMTGSITYYIGVSWCFGTWNHTTMTCNGSPVDNTSQTDSLGGDLVFEVEQYRNNPVPFQSP